METHTASPSRIAGCIASHDPCGASGVEQTLRTEDVGLKEELRVFDAAIHVALCCKVHHHVKAVVGEESVDERAVADVAFDKEAARVVNVVGNGAEIAGIGEEVKHHDLNVGVFLENVLHVVGSDETGASGDEISFHESTFLKGERRKSGDQSAMNVSISLRR